MLKKVISFTQTHNSENTIGRCIESVLSQTHENLVYYIADNGSTDGTREIIQSYAGKDKRIIPVFRDDNLLWQIYSLLPTILEKYDRNDSALTLLDSDDEYCVCTFERLIRFMRDYSLEYCSCMFDIIDGVTMDDLNKSNLEESLIIQESDFESRFTEYFKFARDSQGKMISLSLLGSLDFASFNQTVLYGSTSYLSLEALGKVNRFGVLAERLYKYYIYPQSNEHSGSKRILTPVLYNYYKDWVISKCGHLSDDNRFFLYGAYIRAIKNRVLPLVNSKIDYSEKRKLLESIFNDGMLKDALSCDALDIVSSNDKRQVLDEVQNFLNQTSSTNA